MILADVIMGADLDGPDLRTGLAAAFGIEEDEVTLVDRLDDLPERYVVVAVRSVLDGGQFPLHLSLFASEAVVANATRLVDWLRRLATTTATAVLTADDESPDPYRFLLVAPGGEVRAVSVDARTLDDDEHYVIA